jgi:hypothetical protein
VSPGGLAEDPDGRVGSAAEEASRLFEAVQQWARRTSGATGEPPSGPDGPGGAGGLGGLAGWAGLAGLAGLSGHVATGSAECQLCPVCQLIGVLKGTRPEVVAHLAEAAGSLLAAVRAAVDAHERDWAARRPAGVERIDIG